MSYSTFVLLCFLLLLDVACGGYFIAEAIEMYKKESYFACGFSIMAAIYFTVNVIKLALIEF